MENESKITEDKNLLELVCEYVSSCSERDLYFIQKSIEFNKEKQKLKDMELKVEKYNTMFEGPTKL